MQTMSNYPGVLLRALASAGAVVGLVAAIADAAVAAPAASVTITERSAAAVEKTAKAPKVMADVQPSTFILDTAAQRLRQNAQKTAAGKAAAAKTVVKMAVKASPPTRTAARPTPGAPHLCPAKAAPHGVIRLAQANPDGSPAAVTAEFGDLKSAPAAGDKRVREFGTAAAKPSLGPFTRTLKLGESQVLAFRWVSKVAIGNPAVADVVALSDNKVLVNTKGVGETNLFVWDNDGQHEYKVVVAQGSQNLNDIARLVSRDLGRDDIKVQAINDTLFLFGKVKTAAEQQQAQAVAAAYTKNVQSFVQLAQDTGAPERPAAVDVANTLNQVFAGGSVRARALSDGNTVVLEGSATQETAEQARHVASAMAKGVTVVDYFQAASTGLRQVMVRSRVIDIDRVKSRELGLDWGPVVNALGPGGIVTKIIGDQPFNFGEARNGPLKLDQGGPLSRFDPIGFKLHALEQRNAARVLSQPNIVVMEGHKAGILIGGEIPIPVAQQSGSGSGTSITVEYKPFGIRLDVEVMGIADDGMMTLRVSPEVSSLDYTNAVTVNGFNLPALRTRRADTVVKIKNGQTLAIGGLLQNDITKNVKAIPLLSNIPIIGELFKSTQFQKGESELVILVTPELPGPDNSVSTPIPNVEMHRPDANVKMR
jgi:pilus assembly protein CpaC